MAMILWGGPGVKAQKAQARSLRARGRNCGSKLSAQRRQGGESVGGRPVSSMACPSLVPLVLNVGPQTSNFIPPSGVSPLILLGILP